MITREPDRGSGEEVYGLGRPKRGAAERARDRAVVISKPIRYPGIYPWFVLLATLDVVLTWMLLGLGGREANVIAAAVITGAGLTGAIALKAASVLTVVLVCEIVARHKERLARGLAVTAVSLTALPVVIAAAALIEYAALVARHT